MSEKPESEEFEDDEAEDAVESSEDLDIDGLIEKFDKRKRGAVKPEEPAWRRLERYREERETKQLLTDFDDYDVGDGESASHSRRKKQHG